VAAWNDDAAASQAARDILAEAAGIEIPSADFVVKVLAIYLLVLVPLNWLVFWLMGKVEWAWIAAPIIAFVGAAAVIRLAQLDIGFARSRTEVAVLEMQGGYERAHLTRFTALYTSLSSSYTLSFDRPESLSAPFPAGKQNEYLATYTDVNFRRDRETSLAGVQVSSNSTGMVHSEQMLPLGEDDKAVETLKLVGDPEKGFSLSNTTGLVLRDIGVLRRVDGVGDWPRENSPRIEAAYVSKLDAGASAILEFAPLPRDIPQEARTDSGGNVSPEEKRQAIAIWLKQWNETDIFASPGAPPRSDADAAADKTRIRLTRLARLATEQLRLLPGDVRLIGWTNQRLPGMRIRPEAPQNAMYTLVLAHLARGDLPPVRPDRNVAEDYIDPTFLETEDRLSPQEMEEAERPPPQTAGKGLIEP
jgi:hypothetical protein